MQGSCTLHGGRQRSRVRRQEWVTVVPSDFLVYNGLTPCNKKAWQKTRNGRWFWQVRAQTLDAIDVPIVSYSWVIIIVLSSPTLWIIYMSKYDASIVCSSSRFKAFTVLHYVETMSFLSYIRPFLTMLLCRELFPFQFKNLIPTE